MGRKGKNSSRSESSERTTTNLSSEKKEKRRNRSRSREPINDTKGTKDIKNIESTLTPKEKDALKAIKKNETVYIYGTTAVGLVSISIQKILNKNPKARILCLSQGLMSQPFTENSELVSAKDTDINEDWSGFYMATYRQYLHTFRKSSAGTKSIKKMIDYDITPFENWDYVFVYRHSREQDIWFSTLVDQLQSTSSRYIEIADSGLIAGHPDAKVVVIDDLPTFNDIVKFTPIFTSISNKVFEHDMRIHKYLCVLLCVILVMSMVFDNRFFGIIMILMLIGIVCFTGYLYWKHNGNDKLWDVSINMLLACLFIWTLDFISDKFDKVSRSCC
jgi:hypothetical protein